MERLWIELTERCNLACSHCCIRQDSNSHDPSKEEVTADFFCQQLSDAVDLGCKRVEFTGGEVLVRNDFEEIYTHAHKMGLSVSITSNLTLLTDKILDLWNKFPPSTLKVSFYGWDDESYSHVVQKPNTFKRFYKNIHKLLERGHHFLALVPAHPLLVTNFPKIHEFATQMGADLPINYGWELILHARRDPDASTCINNLRVNSIEAARLRMTFPKLILNDIRLIRERTNCSLKDDRLFRCNAGDKLLAIDAYGFLQPCRPLRHPDLLYDLKQGTLRKALTEHLPHIREMKINNRLAHERCLRCFLRPACSSCPVTSWIENGNLDEPTEYYCNVIHQEAYWLGILPANTKGWEFNL